MSSWPVHTQSLATTCSPLSYIFKIELTESAPGPVESFSLLFCSHITNCQCKIGPIRPELEKISYMPKKFRQHRGSIPPSQKNYISAWQGNFWTVCAMGLMPLTVKIPEPVLKSSCQACSGDHVGFPYQPC